GIAATFFGYGTVLMVQRIQSRCQLISWSLTGVRRCRPWPLAAQDRPRIILTGDGSAIIVSAQTPSGPGRCYLEVARVDAVTGEAATLFRGEAGLQIGMSMPPMLPWGQSALLVAELEDYPRLWCLAANQRQVPLSPAGIEVQQFAVDLTSHRLAVTG